VHRRLVRTPSRHGRRLLRLVRSAQSRTPHRPGERTRPRHGGTDITATTPRTARLTAEAVVHTWRRFPHTRQRSPRWHAFASSTTGTLMSARPVRIPRTTRSPTWPASRSSRQSRWSTSAGSPAPTPWWRSSPRAVRHHHRRRPAVDRRPLPAPQDQRVTSRRDPRVPRLQYLYLEVRLRIADRLHAERHDRRGVPARMAPRGVRARGQPRPHRARHRCWPSRDGVRDRARQAGRGGDRLALGRRRPVR